VLQEPFEKVASNSCPDRPIQTALALEEAGSIVICGVTPLSDGELNTVCGDDQVMSAKTKMGQMKLNQRIQNLLLQEKTLCCLEKFEQVLFKVVRSRE
jgi:hypothetical protein